MFLAFFFPFTVVVLWFGSPDHTDCYFDLAGEFYLYKNIKTIPLLNCFFVILIISWNVNLCRIWGALVCWWPTFDTRATRVLRRTGSWMYTRLILSRNECQCFIWWTDRSSLHFAYAKVCTRCSTWAGDQN